MLRTGFEQQRDIEHDQVGSAAAAPGQPLQEPFAVLANQRMQDCLELAQTIGPFEDDFAQLSAAQPAIRPWPHPKSRRDGRHGSPARAEKPVHHRIGIVNRQT